MDTLTLKLIVIAAFAAGVAYGVAVAAVWAWQAMRP